MCKSLFSLISLLLTIGSSFQKITLTLELKPIQGSKLLIFTRQADGFSRVIEKTNFWESKVLGFDASMKNCFKRFDNLPDKTQFTISDDVKTSKQIVVTEELNYSTSNYTISCEEGNNLIVLKDLKYFRDLQESNKRRYIL